MGRRGGGCFGLVFWFDFGFDCCAVIWFDCRDISVC